MEAVARVLQASVVKEIVSAKYALLCFFCTHTYDWSLLGETLMLLSTLFLPRRTITFVRSSLRW